MTQATLSRADPIGTFEHAHDHLTKLALGIGEQLRNGGGAVTSAQTTEILTSLEALRDELLHHFADEEEGLFPFVRRTVPGMAAAVDRLEGSHDAICGAVVRLAHMAVQDTGRQLITLYQRFENAYAEHSREEANFFDELGRHLSEPERSELASLLRGLSLR